MTPITRLLLLLNVLCLLDISLMAQNTPNTKWGKVVPEEWKIDRCAYDTSASAVVLFDKGEIEFSNGQAISIRRHKRIKILSTKGLDEANISLPFYVVDQLEKIVDVDAQTINPDALGKMVVQKVPNSQIFEVAEDEKWHEKRFSFPSVKVGSILEFRYTTLSQNYRFLDGWLFQNSLPTLFSEFKAKIPEGLDYHFLMQGTRLLQKYREPVNSWSLSNLPALKAEPYVHHYMDYAEKIQFQLSGYTKIERGISSYESLTTTWEKLAQERMESDNYTRYLNKHGVAKDLLAQLFNGNESDLDKMKKLYQYVQKTLVWNGTYSWFTQNPLSTVLETQKGYSCEINLFLILLLRQSGLEANPVMISTRKHGLVFRSYPFMAQFNHILANVQIQGKDYLLDAIDPFRPYDQLAEADLVNSGYLLDKKKPRWIELPKPGVSKQMTYIEADIRNLAKPQYKVNQKYTGYFAVKHREEYDEKALEQTLKRLRELQPADYQITDLEITDAKAIEMPLTINYTLIPEESENLKKDMIYLKPIIVNPFQENPFKNEVRFLPVELGYPYSYTLTISIKLPDNYQVQELPANHRMAMPNQMAEFSYLSSTTNQLIQIKTTLSIKATIIPSEDYQALREFYSQVVSKYTEQIVLKKM
jgi:transglutaminase-like putative cysteine protease